MALFAGPGLFLTAKTARRNDVTTSSDITVQECLKSIRPCGTERNRTGRSMLFRSVPTACSSIVSKKTCLGPSRILSLASQISSNHGLLHMPRRHDPRHNSSVLLVCTKGPLPSTAMSIVIKQTLFVPARSGRSVLPKEEKGSNVQNKHTCSSFL